MSASTTMTGKQNDMRRSRGRVHRTFWLVFGGCGSAALVAAFPQLGIGFTGIAFAFGLTVLSMAYADRAVELVGPAQTD